MYKIIIWDDRGYHGPSIFFQNSIITAKFPYKLNIVIKGSIKQLLTPNSSVARFTEHKTEDQKWACWWLGDGEVGQGS